MQYQDLRIFGYDHIEFAVQNLGEAERLSKRFGFERVATRSIPERELQSTIMAQNKITIVLSHSSSPNDPISKFVARHGDGICDVAFECFDAIAALELVANQGAEVIDSPRTLSREEGEITWGSFNVFGDVTHSFVSRKGNLLMEGVEDLTAGPKTGFGIQAVDHVTNNVPQGKMEYWADFYERVMGLRCTREFDIRTGRTGLLSKVMESPDGRVKMPINEPTDPKSQIQEYLDINHGPGVQHLALLTGDIISALPHIQQQGVDFLSVPSSYYEAIPSRVPHVKEDLSTLEKLGILVDGDAKGYLLQIFSQNVVGPFFYEVIQRKGNQGFGEGNFRALFEAIERDQERRGVL